MREKLAKVGTQSRFRFSGKFVRFGSKRGWEGVEETTILLKDIKWLATGKQVADHLWFNHTYGFSEAIDSFLGMAQAMPQEYIQKMLLEKNATFEFDGRVENYEKGWQGRQAEEAGEWKSEKDWKISRPTKIKVI